MSKSTEIPMSKALAARVRAFGCTIDINAEGEEAHSFLERYVFPPLPREDAGGSAPDISVNMVQAEGRFHLSVNEVAIGTAERPKELATKLINAIDEAVIRRMTKLYAVHAGAVLIGGRGLLLPGKTHAGKSSLVAELLHRGARYFSDEYALIDSGGRVHSYPRPLLLRNGTPKQFPVLPEECNSSVACTSAPVGWILTLKYQPGCGWNVAEIPQSMAMLSLLQNTPHSLADAPEMVGSFERAVAGAICLAGQRGEAADAIDHILRLIDAT
jgi:hypothetical protein